MFNSVTQLKHLLRVALLTLPLLLLLGLNGRTVTLLRPPATGTRVSAATVVRQRVVLEAASPLRAHYVAPAVLAWLPATSPGGWLPRLVRRAIAAALVAMPAVAVAQACRQRLLRAVLRAQAP